MNDSVKTTPSTNVNLPARLALIMLRVYRAILSPMILGLYGPACRFEPTCSVYAHQAISEYGIIRGVSMAARRLARCRPLGRYGYDPIPARIGAGRE
jgi:putative membrane protein insertion efficiency factor